MHNDGRPRIMCAWMDGTHETVFVEGGNASQGRNMAWPSSLSLDYVGRKLYWSDPLMKTIERIGLDGQNREVVMRISSPSMESTPYAMVYHMGFLYYSEFNPIAGVQQVPVNDTKLETLQVTTKYVCIFIPIPSNQCKLVQKSDNKLMFDVFSKHITFSNKSKIDAVATLRVYDAATQIESDICDRLKCTSLRIPTPNGCVCACADGFTLSADGVKCLADTDGPAINECGNGIDSI